MSITKTCPQCGQQFSDSKHPDRKYCSLKCSSLSKRKRSAKLCKTCGKEFGLSEKTSHLKGRTYCSKKCEGIGRRKPVSSKRETRYCKQCLAPFETWVYRTTQFCSQSCASTFRNPGLTKLHCRICGKEYLAKPSQIRHRNSAYCSLECKYKGTALDKRGTGNVNYRGGTIAYRGRNWGVQSRAALKRDGYRCQICHKKLNRHTHDYGVHHIIPYRMFNHDWESANQLSNLVSLCRSCHAKVEHGKTPCPRPLI